MRRDPTEPEKRLWQGLSSRQLNGLKFRRQAVIGSRIADFFCPVFCLIVEVDGDTHDSGRDAWRDAELLASGLTTLRFTNADVLTNLDGVLTCIAEVAATLPPRTSWRLPHPNPSPEGEGLRSS